MTLTYEQIKPYIEQGYITERVHPVNPDVKIFNYTMECQFDKKWDHVTMNCRGLIMDTRLGETLSNPLPKFFNYDEHLSLGMTIPLEEPVVHDKLDGSLGILYYIDGEPWIATRGSFTSEQAVWATDYFRKHYSHITLRHGYTYLFEIIYPENRIVVNYDFSGLILLAIRPIGGGRELSIRHQTDFKTADEYPADHPDNLKSYARNNAEGFVVHYPEADVRVKVKFDDYVRLHKIVTGLSERGIWEMMVEYGPMVQTRDLLNNVPDEFHQWMDGVLTRLREQYNEISFDAAGAVAKAKLCEGSRKDIAEIITKGTRYPSVAFAMFDGKDYNKVIYKMIRPVGHNVFKEDI